MPWVHEDLTTEAAVFKHFPKAKRYEGTNAGYIKFLKETKWNSYDKFSEEEKGGAAWRLQNAGGPVKMYSKSAGPYSSGRAFTRDALTWFGDGMIQMSLPYHFQSQNAHKYMVPNGDDQNHKIRVSIQFWVSRNEKECVRFDLGFFRPVRKWNQGRFWKVLLVKHGSELIDNINSMIQTTVQTSQKEITELKKNHDKDIADKDEKIKELTDQVASLTTQNKKLKGSNKRLRDSLDDMKTQLEEHKDKLKETNDKLKEHKDKLNNISDGCNQDDRRRSKQKIFLLELKQQRLLKRINELETEVKNQYEFISRQSRTLRKNDIPASQLEPPLPQ
jgi:regulator of replication initiation timing